MFMQKKTFCQTEGLKLISRRKRKGQARCGIGKWLRWHGGCAWKHLKAPRRVRISNHVLAPVTRLISFPSIGETITDLFPKPSTRAHCTFAFIALITYRLLFQHARTEDLENHLSSDMLLRRMDNEAHALQYKRARRGTAASAVTPYSVPIGAVMRTSEQATGALGKRVSDPDTRLSEEGEGPQFCVPRM